MAENNFEPLQSEPIKSGVDLAVLSRVLRAEQRKILTIGLACSLAGIMLAFLLPAQYTSTAAIVPPSSSTSGTAALMGQLSALGGGGGGGLLGSVKGPGDLYVGILKSRSIADTLVKELDLMKVYRVKRESEAVKKLAKHTDVSVGLKDAIITINVTDSSPQRARSLVAAYLNALRNKTGSLALTESSQRRLFYEQRLQKEKDDLANAEVALKEVQERTGLIAPAGQTASEIQAVAQLRAQIAGRQVRLASLRHDESEENPDILRLRSEIASLENQVSSKERGSGNEAGGMSTSQVPAMALDYIRKARDVKYHETLFEIIAKQYEVARLDEAHDTPLQVLDQPTAPDMKSGPPRALIILGFGFVGLLAGAGWVLYAEWHRVVARETAVVPQRRAEA